MTGRAGDRATHRLYRSAARVAMRCALAITLSVIVVAGMLGKTEASIKCTRSRPVG